MIPEFYFLILIAVVAFLYASVGHGGASGYLAVMVLYGVSPAEMKTSALVLNLFVSAISFYSVSQAVDFSRFRCYCHLFCLSIPMAFVGAKIHIETHIYKIVLAFCLLIAVTRILGLFGKSDLSVTKHISFLSCHFNWRSTWLLFRG